MNVTEELRDMQGTIDNLRRLIKADLASGNKASAEVRKKALANWQQAMNDLLANR